MWRRSHRLFKSPHLRKQMDNSELPEYIVPGIPLANMLNYYFFSADSSVCKKKRKKHEFEIVFFVPTRDMKVNLSATC